MSGVNMGNVYANRGGDWTNMHQGPIRLDHHGTISATTLSERSASADEVENLIYPANNSTRIQQRTGGLDGARMPTSGMGQSMSCPVAC